MTEWFVETAVLIKASPICKIISRVRVIFRYYRVDTLWTSSEVRQHCILVFQLDESTSQEEYKSIILNYFRLPMTKKKRNKVVLKP